MGELGSSACILPSSGFRTDLAKVSASISPIAAIVGTPEQVGRVTQAFLKMKKFGIDQLRLAYWDEG